MSSDDELSFISPTSQRHQPSLYTGSTVTTANSRTNYGIVGPQDEITLESDIDLFSDQHPTTSSPSAPSPQPTAMPTSSSSPPPPVDVTIDLSDPKPLPPVFSDDGREYKMWELEYYQKYFNITTQDVLIRMAKSIIPYGDDFFKTIDGRADLYGPFWVPTTLIFFMAATGNFGTYLACADPDLYVADFLKVVYGALAIYGYVVILPLALWGVFKYFDIPLGFVDNLCLYGYSLTVYLPIAVLAIAPSGILRWILLGIGALLVCVCLFRAYWSVAHLNRSASIGIAITLSLCNLGLMIFFRLYLFQYRADDCTPAHSSHNQTRYLTVSSSSQLSRAIM